MGARHRRRVLPPTREALARDTRRGPDTNTPAPPHLTHRPAAENITPAGQRGRDVVPCFWQQGGPIGLASDTKVMARQAGVLRDRVRVLDSTPIYDAVSTQDTVTQLRSAIRKLLWVLDHDPLAVAVRAVLARDDDYC